jgi:hypothetical protein
MENNIVVVEEKRREKIGKRREIKSERHIILGIFMKISCLMYVIIINEYIDEM